MLPGVVHTAFALLPVVAGSLQGASRHDDVSLGPAVAEDESIPEGAVTRDPATVGTTHIAASNAGPDIDARKADDATELEISGGGLLTTGNARSLSVTGTGRLRIRRGRHQFASAFAGNYGRAAPDVDSPVVTTVSNVQGMARYDFFFAKRWAAFLMTTLRNDRFQGLDLRLNIDPGVAFYAIIEPKHRLWFEAGYDFQFDDRRRDSIFEDRPIDPDDPEGPTERVQIADEQATNHAVRLFAGYSNQLRDAVSFDTGLEYLQSVIDGRRIRLNWLNALNAQVGSRVGLSTTFTLRFENQPLPGVEKLDTITALLLNVKFI